MESIRKVKGNVEKGKTIRNKPTKSKPEKTAVKGKSIGESKQSRLIGLLEREGGATIDEMVKLTGWQRHSIRGVISGVLKKRLGRSVTSEKGDQGRVYRIAIL